MEVVILGAGTFIGDMALAQPDRAAVRTATVVAMTQVVTMRISLERFKAVVPRRTLDRMREIAAQKGVLTTKRVEHEVSRVCILSRLLSEVWTAAATMIVGKAACADGSLFGWSTSACRGLPCIRFSAFGEVSERAACTLSATWVRRPEDDGTRSVLSSLLFM
jgi:hypothetical protein